MKTYSHFTIFIIILFLLVSACEQEEPEDPDEQTTTTTTIFTLDLSWVTIPEGTYEMGCLAHDHSCAEDALPVHTVTIPLFEMTTNEITLSQYIAVTGDNASWFSGCPECPVERVGWSDAAMFCEAVGGRLPTEAEWEYAARAETESLFTCGDDEGCLETVAWYDENSDNRTHPVGLLEPNAFGLYDMSGNVWEWVADCRNDSYIGAPTDGSVWDAGTCSQRVLRGGAWNSTVDVLPVWYRDHRNFAGLNNTIGFRCARD